MRHEIFLFRPSPKNNESLTSYIHRVAIKNHVSNHELWRLLAPNTAHYPQASLSNSLDIYPYSFFDLNLYESMLLHKEHRLHTLTFIPLFEKFGIYIDTIPHSRILSGLIDKYRKYCPACLEEYLYYKLIWQVKEITWCPKHNISLFSKCWNCNKNLNLLPSDSQIGICPYCGEELKNAPAFQTEINNSRLQIDWEYLLNPNKGLKPIQNCSIQQSLALKLLYMAQNNNLETTSLKPILQIARESKVNQTFVHLSSIFKIIRKVGISMEDFLCLDVPTVFIKSIFKTHVSMNKQYACLAPWCESYQRPGSLIKTSTSTKHKKDGSHSNYYMFCSKCGIEYCIDDKKNLVERGYFISFAWGKIKEAMNQPVIIKEISKSLKVPVDKIRRSIIFLLANKLIKNDNLPLSVPKNHSPELINSFIELINSGLNAKIIPKRLNLSYNEFLYYWYLPEIKIAYIRHKKPQFKRADKTERNNLFNEALDYFALNNIAITIKSVCEHIGICPETLRNWGLLSKLKEAKELQKNKQIKINTSLFEENARIIIAGLLNNKSVITSEEVYKLLGVKRNILVRTYPDVQKYISSLMKKAKK